MPKPMDIEIRIAREDAALEAGVETLGEPSTYACPECHGVLRQWQEGGRVRFRCHTGHAYSVETLVADMDEAIEESLWSSIRALQEKVILARHLEEHARAGDEAAAARALARLADHAEERADLVRRAVMEPELTEADNVGPEEDLSGEAPKPR